METVVSCGYNAVRQGKTHLRCFGDQRIRNNLRLTFEKALDNNWLVFKQRFLSFVFLLQVIELYCLS